MFPLAALFIGLATLGISSAQRYDGQYWPCNPVKNATGACTPNRGLTDTTYFIDFTKITGWPDHWILANYENVTFGPKGAEFSFAKRYDAPQIWTDFYMLFGKIDVVMQVAPGVGIISSSVLMSDDFDEIDWEFSGNNFGDTSSAGKGQNNYFGKGITGNYDRGQYFNVKSPQTTYHTYTIDWTPESITWSVDGVIIRTLLASSCDNNTHQYPQTPSKLQLGLWDGGDPSADYGTWNWAGGHTNLSLAPFTMYVKSVNIVNANPAYAYNYTDRTGRWQSIQLLKEPVSISTTATVTSLPSLAPSASSSIVSQVKSSLASLGSQFAGTTGNPSVTAKSVIQSITSQVTSIGSILTSSTSKTSSASKTSSSSSKASGTNSLSQSYIFSGTSKAACTGPGCATTITLSGSKSGSATSSSKGSFVATSSTQEASSTKTSSSSVKSSSAASVYTTTHIVSTVTTYCPSATTLTINNRTYPVSSATTLTISGPVTLTHTTSSSVAPSSSGKASSSSSATFSHASSGSPGAASSSGSSSAVSSIKVTAASTNKATTERIASSKPATAATSLSSDLPSYSNTNTTRLTCEDKKMNGTTYTAEHHGVYEILCGIDYRGGDMSSAVTPNFGSCIELCDATKGCVDVSYVAPSMACYLKSHLTSLNVTSYVWTAKRIEVRAPGSSSSSSVSSKASSAPSASSKAASSSKKAALSSIASTYTTIHVVSTLTTYCPSATKLTINSKTYTVTSESTLTITDCPCTLTKTTSTMVPVASASPLSSKVSSSGPSKSALSSASSLAATPSLNTYSATKAVPSSSSVSSTMSTYTTTHIVSTLTTYCSEPTTLTVNSQTYTVTTESTLTITDCPCTLTKTTSTMMPVSTAPSNAPAGSASLSATVSPTDVPSTIADNSDRQQQNLHGQRRDHVNGYGLSVYPDQDDLPVISTSPSGAMSPADVASSSAPSQQAGSSTATGPTSGPPIAPQTRYPSSDGTTNSRTTSTITSTITRTKTTTCTSTSTTNGPLNAASTTPNPPLCDVMAKIGKTHVDLLNKTYTLQCGTDHWGGDLTANVTTEFAGCFPICDMTPGCLGFAFVSGNSNGTCYLKKTITAASNDSKVDSALLVKGDGKSSTDAEAATGSASTSKAASSASSTSSSIANSLSSYATSAGSQTSSAASSAAPGGSQVSIPCPDAPAASSTNALPRLWDWMAQHLESDGRGGWNLTVPDWKEIWQKLYERR
ncbi:hypothetical protein H2203_004909 [Taxawa tesnikishii (nom. ined.)]|nr:hypothetical protein H2203_004909 [Dothideales sp. JES 119]